MPSLDEVDSYLSGLHLLFTAHLRSWISPVTDDWMKRTTLLFLPHLPSPVYLPLFYFSSPSPSLSISISLPPSLPLSLSPFHPLPSLPLSLSPSLTPLSASLPLSLSPCLLLTPLPLTLPSSHPPSLSPSLPPSHPPSLPLTLPPSHPPSLSPLSFFQSYSACLVCPLILGTMASILVLGDH